LPPAPRDLAASAVKAGVSGKRGRFGRVMLKDCRVCRILEADSR